MGGVRDRYHTAEEITQSRPDELGTHIILDLQKARQGDFFSPSNYPDNLARQYGANTASREFASAVLEALAWAQRELLLVKNYKSMPPSDALMLSRAGSTFTADELPRMRIERVLPQFLLHYRLRSVCMDIFNSGHYQAAVFEAFRVLEVAIRERADYGEIDYGTDMISRAFNDQQGPLRDRTATEAERQAMQRLMSGAYGVYKNPSGHRDIELTDPQKAAELLIIASHLLRIVEARSHTQNPPVAREASGAQGKTKERRP
jgi:uncharacterized protein (TIGR02391 family)